MSSVFKNKVSLNRIDYIGKEKSVKITVSLHIYSHCVITKIFAAITIKNSYTQFVIERKNGFYFIRSYSYLLFIRTISRLLVRNGKNLLDFTDERESTGIKQKDKNSCDRILHTKYMTRN